MFPFLLLFLLFSIKLFVVNGISRTQIFDSDIFRITLQCMSLIYMFVCFLIRLTVLPFLFEQICQLAGHLRATLNGLNRYTNIFEPRREKTGFLNMQK